MLSLENISYRFSQFSLENISASIPVGARVALLGLNGSGKSTLLHCLSGQYKIQSGKIFWQDKFLTTHSAAHEVTSFLPQRLNFPLSCTGLELVLFALTEKKTFFHFDQALDVEKALHYLQLTHATDFAHRQLSEISGGELQRVALAAVLARNSPVLLLDEPFTFLDIREQKNMLQLFHKLQQDNPQLTLIMSSHQLELVQHWCSHVIILKKGKLAAFLAKEQLNEISLLQKFEEFA